MYGDTITMTNDLSMLQMTACVNTCVVVVVVTNSNGIYRGETSTFQMITCFSYTRTLSL
jgi:hypothetical protein